MNYILSLILVLGFANLCNANETFICKNGRCMVNSKPDQSFIEAVNNLEKACDLARKIKNEDSCQLALSEIEDCKECLKKEYFNFKNYEAMEEKASTLYENIDEILAECDDDNLRLEIPSYIGKAVEQLQIAQKSKNNS